MPRKIALKSERSSTVISVRLDEEELTALRTIMAEHGLAKRNTALRALIRAAGGLLEVDAELRQDWRTASRALVQIGNNLNQLSRQAKRGALIWGDGEQADFLSVRRQALRAARMLADFARAAQNRGASKHLIEKAVRDLRDV